MNQDFRDVGYREEGGNNSFSIRDILYILFMRKWQMTAFFVVVVTAGIIAAAKTPVVYESHTKFLVHPGREIQTVDPAIKDRRPTLDIYNVMRSELAILESRKQAELVVDSLGLDYFRNMFERKTENAGQFEESLAPITESFDKIKIAIDKVRKGTDETKVKLSDGDLREMAIRKIMGGLEVTRRDSLVTLTYTDTDGKRAHDLLCCIMDSYKAHRSQIYMVSPEQFRKETERIKGQLEEQELALESYLQDLNVSTLEDEHEVLMTQYTDLEGMISASEVIIKASETKVRSIERMAMANPEGPGFMGVIAGRTTDRLLEMFHRKILELEMEEAAARTTYQKKRILEQKTKLNKILEDQQLAIQQTAAEESGAGAFVATASSELELTLALAQINLDAELARRDALIAEWNKTKKRLTELQRHRLPVDRLQREITILEDYYLEYQANLRRAEIQAAMDTQAENSIKVIEDATLPLNPNNKTRNRILGAAGFVAFFGSFASAFLLNALNNKVKTPEEIERKLGIPVLASFPRTRQHTVRLVSGDGSWSARALAPFKRKSPAAAKTEKKETARS